MTHLSARYHYRAPATGGDKLPQRPLALTQFLALGAEYDVIINLGGFNAVALPVAEKVPLGVNPRYPRVSNLYAAKIPDGERTPQFVCAAERTAKLRELRSEFANPALLSPAQAVRALTEAALS